MASPILDTLCCMFTQSENDTMKCVTKHAHHQPDFQTILGYIIFTTLLLSSTVSIIGTTITLVPKPGLQRTRRDAVADDRQRTILSWLAASDLVACIGMILFAIFSMVQLRDPNHPKTVGETIFCIIVTVWIQYFYLATYFWSFFYALDVFLMLKGVNWKFLFRTYFLITWLLSTIILVVSLISVYYTRDGRLNCSPSVRKHYSKAFIWGSYVVLLVVFLAMPILYFLSSRQIAPMLRRGGVYTDRERRVKAQIQKKFLRIVIVFLVCWSPNIVNAVTVVVQLSKDETDWCHYAVVYVPTWLMMALLNPMQAFFNALVYWGPAGCTKVHTSVERTHYIAADNTSYRGQMSGPTSLNATGTGEQTPLLRSMVF